jgi:lipopolysaccharide/colanic/teichoic acid biosynthesis glycosyltransferase/nucleoside-diphosphate-sugar epimerase
MKVLVTGTTGFVGRTLLGDLRDAGHEVVKYNRSHDLEMDFSGIDVVIHLAAKVHQFAPAPYLDYKVSNVDLTEFLIKKSIAGKVKHFIFLSTIKVSGEGIPGKPYHPSDSPAPADFYSQSKWDAEQLLVKYAGVSNLKFTIIRPPLIYGPGVGANFLRLWKMSQLPIPLPFGAVKNRRSLLYVKNLSAFIIFCMSHEKVLNQTILLSDGEDVSTPDLISTLASGSGKTPILIPIPQVLLEWALKLIGKTSIYERLCGDLFIDSSFVKENLGWASPYSVQEALTMTSRSLKSSVVSSLNPIDGFLNGKFKRLIDVVSALALGAILFVPMLLTFLYIKIVSPGPAIYWSKRVGRNNSIFFMPKFRTMRLDTPQVATHLLENPDQFLIPSGKLIRKLSLDELPQLYSVIKGDMSFVGPRPALFNQDDLIKLRTDKSVHLLRPGITGWAQVNGRDEIPIPQKVEFDHYYFKNKSILLDLKILFLTFYKVIFMKNVSH